MTEIRVLKFLENPRYPSLGPQLRLLKLSGMMQPNAKSFKKHFKLFIYYIIILFFLSQYVRCIIDFKIESLQLILQYIPFHIGMIKMCLFRKDHKKWSKLIDYLSLVERLQIEDREKNKEVADVINDYVQRNRRFTYFYWMLALFSNINIFSKPYQENRAGENGTSIYLNFFDGFTAFSREPPGYYGSVSVQTVIGLVVSSYIVGWDTIVVCIMIFFAGQLKITRIYAKHVTISNDMNESHQNIRRCHNFYLELIKNQKIFNDLIYAIMFVYLIVITINLGICIIQIVEVQDDLATLVSSCFFLLCCLIQLLVFYWYSNEVTEESLKVSCGSYESNWFVCNQMLKKETHLLGLTLNKRLVFKAGPLNEMSLTTFVSILRASYSFYTLLNNTK